jgi:fructose-specific phosphotransferase system IIB component
MAKIVCVTSCMTGIAQTYMAAEALEQAGRKLGHDLKVEAQGSAGAKLLDAADIEAADGVIFAVDLRVRDRDRFIGKPFIEVPVNKAMHGSQELITVLLASIANGTAVRVGEGPSNPVALTKKPGFFARLLGKR